jgi:multidrug efflux system membrane fusion protein
VRIVAEGDKAAFAPVTIVDDAVDTVWVTGLDGSVRVITVGQDFVRDGDAVVPVPASPELKPGVSS